MKTEVRCREFGCANNKAGQCKSEKIILQKSGETIIVGRLICAEAEPKEKPDEKDGEAGECDGD